MLLLATMIIISLLLSSFLMSLLLQEMNFVVTKWSKEWETRKGEVKKGGGEGMMVYGNDAKRRQGTPSTRLSSTCVWW